MYVVYLVLRLCVNTFVQIYECDVSHVVGLVHLLTLEHLSYYHMMPTDPPPRSHSPWQCFLNLRRYWWMSSPMNNYDETKLRIPYGLEWHARRIEKLVYATDLRINCLYNSWASLASLD